MKTNTKTFTSHLFLFIGILSSLLILTLTIVNNGSANDDHLEVSKIIYESNSLPSPRDCWSCYHPKLYHISVAKVWHLLDIHQVKQRIIAAQLINGIAGLLTIFYFFLYIRKQSFPGHVKCIAFALFALNPRLISTFAQPSNDAFIIAIGTFILYYLDLFLRTNKFQYFVLVTICSILAVLAKTSGFIFALAILLVLLTQILIDNKRQPRKKWLLYFLGYGIAFFVGVLCTGEYYKTYKKYDTLVVYNTPIGEIPHFYKESTFRRPGVKSIYGGYFTFRIIDMIQHPIVNNNADEYQLHRTSVWSQLYGRTHFLYFDDWPPGKWRKVKPWIYTVGSISLALALIPTLFLCIGFLIDMKVYIQLIKEKNLGLLQTNFSWIFHTFFIGFVSFIVLFTLKGRDYSFMKIIYLFPVLLTLVVPLLHGTNKVSQLIKNQLWLQVILSLILLTLLSLYVTTLINLIVVLTS